MAEMSELSRWEKELAQFQEVLASPEGQAIVIVGPEGSGKSTLLRMMVNLAMNVKEFHCDGNIYGVGSSDRPNNILQKIGSGSGEKMVYIGATFVLERLSRSVEEFGDLHRRVVGVDANPTMPADFEREWLEIIPPLPEKVKFIFTQRPDGILATNKQFMDLPNVVRIDIEAPPKSDERKEVREQKDSPKEGKLKEDENKTSEKELEKKFIQFLIKDKGYPRESILPANKGGEPDLSIIEPGSKKPIVLIEFKLSNEHIVLGRLALDFLHYKQTQKLSNCLAYIVCPSLDKSSEPFEIIEIIDNGYESLLSINDFPTYEELRKRVTSETEATEGEGSGDKIKKGVVEEEKNDFEILLSMLGRTSRRIIDTAWTLAKKVDPERLTLTTSLLLFATSELGRGEKIHNSAWFIHKTIKQRESEVGKSYFERKKNERQVSQTAQKGEGAQRSFTNYVLGVLRNSRGIAIDTTGKERINARHLLAGLILYKPEKGETGAQRRLKEMVIDTKSFCEEFLQFLKYADLKDDYEAWQRILGGEVSVEDMLSAEAVESQKEEAVVVGNVATMVSDKASIKDLLGRTGLVKALASMFVLSREMEGFTVALFGNWGEGKSTIMELLENHLKNCHRKRFVFAKFNAWEYEKTENIAAGLALEVVKGLKKSFNILCRLTLLICFIIREHGLHFVWWFVKFGLAASPFILLYYFRGRFGLSEQQDKIVNDLFGISLAGVGSIVIGFYVLKNFKHIVEHPLVTNLETFLKLPNYGKHLGLVPVLKRHIKILCSLSLKAGIWKWRWGKDKKLIVFVDDLDRCQPKCIAETFDAIRLVMENQNVIVFIGIDHRIAFKAIGEHYQKVGNESGGRRKGEIARDYLGKIIQLPIRLQEPTVQGLEGFINERLFPNVEISEKTQEKLKPIEVFPGERTIETKKTPEETGTKPEVPPDEESVIDTKEILSEEITEEEMQDTEGELDEFYDMTKKFGFTNPRQLLRLRNCYRLIKALELQKAHKEKRELGFEKLKDFMRMLFWQEFLHNRSKRLRTSCVKVLYENVDSEKISDERTKVIIKQVKNSIIESFADKNIYDKTAEDVRIVVLPHSQED